MKQIQELMNQIGYTFRNPAMLSEALTHSSYANESGRRLDFNERLEFLGDSVLGLIAAEYLYLRNRASEGELTKLRAAIVCEKALCDYAGKLDLGRFLLLGKGEEKNGGRGRPSILADAFEALTAALYLDGGMDAARRFLIPFLEEEADNQKKHKFRDYKTILQELVQQTPGDVLVYVLAGESGPDHQKSFVSQVRLHSNILGSGTGRSKKEAEQQAAREALKLMGYDY